jgi:predicted Na+-dependent transporter
MNWIPSIKAVLDFAVPALTFLLMIAVGLALTIQDFLKVASSPKLVTGAVERAKRTLFGLVGRLKTNYIPSRWEFLTR